MSRWRRPSSTELQPVANRPVVRRLAEKRRKCRACILAANMISLALRSALLKKSHHLRTFDDSRRYCDWTCVERHSFKWLLFGAPDDRARAARSERRARWPLAGRCAHGADAHLCKTNPRRRHERIGQRAAIKL